MSSPLVPALLLVVVLAVWMDVRQRRIPNGLTGVALLLALALRALAGAGALQEGLLGAGLAAVLLLPLFLLGGVGGGDAKLMIAIGGFLGPTGFLVAMLATALAGGVLSVGYALRRRVLLPVLLNTRGLLQHLVTGGRSGERVTLQAKGGLSIPYALAIAVGTLFAVWYGYQ